MADDIAKLRAALSSSWDDNTPIPQMSQSVNPLDIIKAAYQNMPGAGVAQAGLAIGSDMFGGLMGNLYGVGKQAATGQLNGSPQGTEYAFNQAQNFANATHYTPPTQAGRDIYEGVNRLPQVVTGSHMGVGPLPEIWNNAPHMSPDDLRVAGRTATQDIRNFGSDYANAQAGIYRDYPTMGSRAAGATDTATQMAKPMAEMAYNHIMETGGIKSPFGMPDIPVSNFAVKPKGGNWPTNLGSTNPLSEQGALGKHLSEVQYSDPVAVFENQLEKHFARGFDNRQLVRDWEDFLHTYLSNGDFDVTKSVNDLKREAADKFAEGYNDGTIGSADIEPTDKKLHTASQIAETLPHYNAWVMGPYQKYITNQMGTGLATDPLLQAVNEGQMPPHEIFGQMPPRDWETDSITRRAQQRRGDFFNTMFGYSDAPEKRATLENSPIGKITATTLEGLTYENALDASLYAKGPYSFTAKEGYPVSAKLDRNSLISDFLTIPEDETGLREIRKQVFQDLLSGKTTPDKLSNVTPATVTRQMIKDKLAEFKAAQLSKKGAEEWIPKRAAQLPTDTAFDDGSKMAIITPEMANVDEAMTARDLGQITIDLNQCVGAGCHATQDYPGHGPYLVPHTGKPPRGKVEYDKYGYMRRLKNGDIEIGTLKDPQGVSQATLELKLEKQNLTDYEKDKIVNQWIKDNAPDFRYEYNTNIEAFGEKPALKTALQLYPELENVLKNATPIEKSVQQIKGHSNNEVKPEYVPKVVEWLNKNADNLTDVRDLGNLKGVHDLDNHYSSIGNMTDERPHWYSPTVEDFFKTVDDEKLLPRFFTTNDFAKLATERGVDLSAEPPKQLSDWDKQTISEEMYRVLVNNPNSLYLQDNLKDHYVESMDLLLGDRKPEGQIPVDIHGNLIELLLNHDKKNQDLITSVLGQLVDKGPNGWVDQFTEPQIQNMLNIMAGWFDKNPLEKLPTNEDFNRAIIHHPHPFDEVKFLGQDWNTAPDNYWQYTEGV